MSSRLLTDEAHLFFDGLQLVRHALDAWRHLDAHGFHFRDRIGGLGGYLLQLVGRQLRGSADALDGFCGERGFLNQPPPGEAIHHPVKR
jgi:hypothetical protein